MFKKVLEALIIIVSVIPDIIKYFRKEKIKNEIKDAEKDFNSNNDTSKYEQLLK